MGGGINKMFIPSNSHCLNSGNQMLSAARGIVSCAEHLVWVYLCRPNPRHAAAGLNDLPSLRHGNTLLFSLKRWRWVSMFVMVSLTADALRTEVV